MFFIRLVRLDNEASVKRAFSRSSSAQKSSQRQRQCASLRIVVSLVRFIALLTAQALFALKIRRIKTQTAIPHECLLGRGALCAQADKRNLFKLYFCKLQLLFNNYHNNRIIIYTIFKPHFFTFHFPFHFRLRKKAKFVALLFALYARHIVLYA